jgi:hypothetical protein
MLWQALVANYSITDCSVRLRLLGFPDPFGPRLGWGDFSKNYEGIMKSIDQVDSRTRMSPKTYQRCMAAAREFLKKNDTIRNRQLRLATGIGYDQAIAFFNRAILEKTLIRQGHSSGTHYILAQHGKK